jgi:predicted amidophosphoribosyltransferase
MLSLQDLNDLGVTAGEIEYTDRLSDCCGARVTELGELCSECGEPA